MIYSNMPDAGIDVRQLSCSWRKPPQVASDFVFRDLSFHISPGEFVTFVGPSGCGKTTLLNALGGLIQPHGGTVYKDGERIYGPDRDLGFVFQDYSLFPWLTVMKNIEFGMSLQGMSASEKHERASYILHRVGLGEYRDYYPHQLSGGMKQRTAIARALANGSRYLLMDEPFGALDYQTRLDMQEFLSEICLELKRTVLFVTHHLEEAVMLSDRVFLVAMGNKEYLQELVIDMPRPRNVASSDFNDYRRYLLDQFKHRTKGEIHYESRITLKELFID